MAKIKHDVTTPLGKTQASPGGDSDETYDRSKLSYTTMLHQCQSHIIPPLIYRTNFRVKRKDTTDYLHSPLCFQRRQVIWEGIGCCNKLRCQVKKLVIKARHKWILESGWTWASEGNHHEHPENLRYNQDWLQPRFSLATSACENSTAHKHWVDTRMLTKGKEAQYGITSHTKWWRWWPCPCLSALPCSDH